MDDDDMNDLNMSFDGSLQSDDELVNLVDVNYNVPESQKSEPVEYEILPPERLTELMFEIVTSVQQIIPISPTYIRLLLATFKWDKDALIEYYFEHGRTQTFVHAHLYDPDSTETEGTSSSLSLCAKDEFDCDICYFSTTLDKSFGLSCNHYFCIDCWERYLKWKIMEESQTDRIYCPSTDCEHIIRDEVVFEMITDATVRKRFQKLTTNSFVIHNRSLTWCPGANCGYAVRCFMPHDSYQISCTNCNECFCFACGQPWHDPVRCEQLKVWLKKVSDDGGSLGWIAANTKECPKCHAVIEKNGGCNHIVCRNVDCKYQFCWMCLDRWEPHGSRWYACNRFGETAAKLAREAQVKSRYAIDRYLFYFDRYCNHAQSLKFEARLYETVQNKIESMQVHGAAWVDVNFFKNLVETLCRCRRTLMYTYVFAYFLKDNNHSLIFESNQSDLERVTEQLSEFFDRDLSTVDLNDMKQKLQDKARYCETRRHVLLDHVHEGYDKGFWEQDT